MAVNRGKQFERVIRKTFEEIPEVSIDRLHDQTTGFKGSQNICDFIVYKEPYEYYFECKTVHGNTLPFTNITDTQWNGLLAKTAIPGVYAGIICWWVDKGITKFIPIRYLNWLKRTGHKSIRFDNEVGTIIYGKKKRVFFEYDVMDFLERLQNGEY